MKKTMLKFVMLIFMTIQLVAPKAIMSQRKCGTMESLEMQLKADPTLKSRLEEIERQTEEYLRTNSANLNKVNATITIPVVVHVVWYNNAQNISTARINEQLKVLNDDYSRTNADAGNTPNAFKNVAAATNIRFCMAQRDPNGNVTSGIIRKQTTVNGFDQFLNNVKFTSQGGDDAWPSCDYMNIWICNFNDANLLGYGQPPGLAANTDGVALNYGTVGGPGAPGTENPFHLGRTGSHEVGHWLNLRHIWGDDNGACTGSDFVNDTPNQAGPNFGCPSFPHVSCNNGPNGDMFMNYMDYSDDACYNMFTQGQSARMDATMAGPRACLINSKGCQPPCIDPVSQFHFEDKNGVATTDFCFGEDVYLNGSASTDETAYEIVLSERLIADGPWAPFVWPNNVPLVLPWKQGQIGTVNLTQLIANSGVQFCFSTLKEYKIGLRLANTCGGYAETTHQFKFHCCNGSSGMQANFVLGQVPNPNGNGYLISALNYNLYNIFCAGHEWWVFRSLNTNGPYEFMASMTTQNFKDWPIDDQYCYLVIHKLNTECGTICYGQQICNNNGAAQLAPCTYCGPLANCQMPPMCQTPTGLSCYISPLTNQTCFCWLPVPGATGYEIEFTYFDPMCCGSLNSPFTTSIIVTNNCYCLPTNSSYPCFSWRVSAICPGGKSAPSAKQCYIPGSSCGPPRLSDEASLGFADITVSPNPVKDEALSITILGAQDFDITKVDIFAIDGRLLQSITIKGPGEEKIDVSKLSPGMYIVKALQNGKAVYTTKFQKL